MYSKTRKITTVSILSAFAYMVMVLGCIPIVLFLKYNPKDVIIVISCFVDTLKNECIYQCVGSHC